MIRKVLPIEGKMVIAEKTKVKLATQPEDIAHQIIQKQVSNELFFAVVGHAGSGTSNIAEKLKDILEREDLKGGSFTVKILKARDVILDWAKTNNKPIPTSEPGKKKIENTIILQDYGDEMRKADFATIASGLIAKIRLERKAMQSSEVADDAAVVPDGNRRAYILDSPVQ